METKTIPLKKPLTTHEGPVKAIILQEPSFDDYMMFGDPWTVAAGNEGTPFAVENIDVIRQYLAVCLKVPKDPALLSQAGARVAKQVKEAILSFFRPDVEAGEDQPTSQTSLPSAASASTPPASNV